MLVDDDELPLLVDTDEFDEADVVAFALAEDDAVFLGEGLDDDLAEAELVDLAEFAGFAEAWDVAECVGPGLQLGSGLAFAPDPADLAPAALELVLPDAGVVGVAAPDAEVVGAGEPLVVPDAEMVGVAVPLDDEADAVAVPVVVAGEVVLASVTDACTDADAQGLDGT